MHVSPNVVAGVNSFLSQPHIVAVLRDPEMQEADRQAAITARIWLDARAVSGIIDPDLAQQPI